MIVITAVKETSAHVMLVEKRESHRQESVRESPQREVEGVRAEEEVRWRAEVLYRDQWHGDGIAVIS